MQREPHEEVLRDLFGRQWATRELGEDLDELRDQLQNKDAEIAALKNGDRDAEMTNEEDEDRDSNEEDEDHDSEMPNEEVQKRRRCRGPQFAASR